jgi:hypothetical protein
LPLFVCATVADKEQYRERSGVAEEAIGTASATMTIIKGSISVLQMIDEHQQTADAICTLDGARFVQCRFPVAHYEWLRYRAFFDRSSMNSIVLEAITEMQAGSPDVTTPLALRVAATKPGSVKFNVHLSDEMYEWLRTKAFNSRGSINQLLIKALSEYRMRDSRSSFDRVPLKVSAVRSVSSKY